MSDRTEVRLSGEGGQGLVLAGIILAEAAIGDGRNAVQTQAYGPESRGGASRSDVIISDGEIDYPKATRLDLLLALTQEGCDRYVRDVAPGGLVLVDRDKVPAVPPGRYTVVPLPILAAAKERAGKALVANQKHLGQVVDPALLRKAATEVAGLPDEWEELPESFWEELGSHLSIQCADICSLAAEAERGAELRIFRKREA